MTREQLEYYHKQRLFLCKECKFHGRDKDLGMICKITIDVPDYFVHCPKFKHKLNIIEVDQQVYFLIFFIALFFFIFALFVKAYELAFFSFIAMFFSFPLVIKNSIELFRNPKFGMYKRIITYVASIKGLKNDDQSLIDQQISKVYEVENINEFKSFYKKNIRKKNILKKTKLFLTFTDKIHAKRIFQKVCEFYAFNNEKNYTEDGLIEKIGEFMKMHKSFVAESKSIMLELEKLRIEYLKEEKDGTRRKKRQSYSQSWNKANYDFSRAIYYDILGLKKSATESEIKKKYKILAKKYHPDKFAGQSEEKIEAVTEKFQEISEAYTYIRRLKNF